MNVIARRKVDAAIGNWITPSIGQCVCLLWKTSTLCLLVIKWPASRRYCGNARRTLVSHSTVALSALSEFAGTSRIIKVKYIIAIIQRWRSLAKFKCTSHLYTQQTSISQYSLRKPKNISTDKLATMYIFYLLAVGKLFIFVQILLTQAQNDIDCIFL